MTFADLDRVHGTSFMESRPDRPYDQCDPCLVIHPNGSVMRVGNGPDEMSRHLAAAVVREVLSMMGEAVYAVEEAG